MHYPQNYYGVYFINQKYPLRVIKGIVDIIFISNFVKTIYL